MFEIYSAISEIYLLIYILLYDFIMKSVKKYRKLEELQLTSNILICLFSHRSLQLKSTHTSVHFSNIFQSKTRTSINVPHC